MELKPSEICKVLSVETRLQIIKLLKTKGPLGAKDIAGYLGVTVAAVSQHLKILSQAGVVTGERKGFCIPYTLNEEVLGQFRKLLTEVCLCGCSDFDSTSLEDLVKFEADLNTRLITVRERIKAIQSNTEGK
jgi:DNA-binding transcriptional ArsR family regulator